MLWMTDMTLKNRTVRPKDGRMATQAHLHFVYKCVIPARKCTIFDLLQ